MIESSTSKDRRAQLAALFGAILQILFFLTLVVVGNVYASSVSLTIARWMVGGVVIWPILALVYGQRRRTEEERREAEQLKHTRSAEGVAAIFDTEDEAYLIERRRLGWMLRWIVPTGAVLLAVYHLVIAVVTTQTGTEAGGWGWWSWNFQEAYLENQAFHVTTHRGIVMAFVGGVGFLAFLYSRYTAGMARMHGWRMLRSGASYLAGNALACLIALIAIGIQSEDFPYAEPVAAYAIRVVLFVLGIEFLANYALDFYRPRTVGQESRPAFDSRMLALITEPGGIARSIAEAINYQFGFEVSSTWFYQLLKRAMLPMIAFGLIALFALSSVLIVDADERAVVERFGRRLQGPGESLTPGLYFKAPWPIDKAYTVRVQQVRSLTVGTVAKQEDQYEDFNGTKRLKPIIWGEKHDFNTEMMLVLASPQLTNFEVGAEDADAAEQTGKAVAVGLLMVSVDIQYFVDDIHGYLYEYLYPDKIVEAIAYQVLTDYAASVDVDRFLGPGRSIVNLQLHDELQRRLSEADLGIHILYVALQDAHPTDDVAKAFQDVVKAEIEKETHIQNAHGEAEKTLTAIAGSSTRASILDNAIIERDRLAQLPDVDPEELAAAAERVDDLLLGAPEKNIPPTGGDAARRIAQVSANVQKLLTENRRALTLFNAEVAAYQAAPQLYKVRKYLTMLQEATTLIRKYVVVVDPSKRVLIIYEKESKGTIDLEQPAQ